MAELTSIAILIAVFGILMATSVLSSRLLERLGVPIVLLFIVLGMLAGSEGLGGIAFDDYHVAFQLGTIALILILFDGGLNTPLTSVRAAFLPAGILATFGVIGTAGMVALFGRILGLTWRESLLLGAIVSSTDAAAVFAVLRGAGLQLNRRVRTTLEIESSVNDPMAVILTVAVIQGIVGDAPDWRWMLVSVPMQLVIGLLIGLACGWLTRVLLQRVRLTTSGLYPVLTLGLAFVAFGAATLAQGSGIMAVYTAAVVLGNGHIPYRAGLTRVHDGLAWLSQIAMFVMMGLLVFPSQLLPVAGQGLGIALFLAFIGRPLVVALCLLPFGFPAKEVVYMGWVGLRAAVPIILATFPLLSGITGANKVFNIVFFVVVANSALLPGATIRYVTRRLGLEAPDVPTPTAALEINSNRLLQGDLLSFYITDVLAVSNMPLSKIPFPPHTSVVLLVRGEQLIAPRGSTVLMPGDHVYVFCRPEDHPFLELLFGRSQELA
jgi:cell volume regulation protein A